MAKASGTHVKIKRNKRTSQGRRNLKISSMNKSQKRSLKAYRGQG